MDNNRTILSSRSTGDRSAEQVARALFAVLALSMLAGCNEAEWFERGDKTEAIVARINGDKCEFTIFLRSEKRGGDLNYRARLLTPECTTTPR